MQYRRLGRTDMDVSILSFGASSLGSVFRDVPVEQGVAAVHRAIDLGINFIDCSPYYGLTKAETVLGEALSALPRDKYYLATKCGRYGATVEDCDYSAQRVTRSVDESLQRLRVDYLDLIQVHDMEFADIDQVVNETIPALEKVCASGKARYVGITGLPLRLFRDVTDRVGPGRIHTILSYCHYELNDTALLALVPEMQAKGVGIINASPLGMGLLSNRGVPDWHPAPEPVKQRCAQAAEFCRSRGADLMKLAVQFSVRPAEIATTLVGTGNPANIEKNVQWIDEPIDQDLLREVLDILEPIQNVTWSAGRPENN